MILDILVYGTTIIIGIGIVFIIAWMEDMPYRERRRATKAKTHAQE